MAQKKKKATVKKVKVTKVVAVAPELHRVNLELEVVGAPEIPAEPLAVDLELDPNELIEKTPHKNAWVEWLKSLW